MLFTILATLHQVCSAFFAFRHHRPHQDINRHHEDSVLIVDIHLIWYEIIMRTEIIYDGLQHGNMICGFMDIFEDPKVLLAAIHDRARSTLWSHLH